MQTRPLAVAVAWVALSSTAMAQGEPEQRNPTARLTLGVDYSYAWFRGDIDSWHLMAFSTAATRAGGTLVGRANVARRFATTGVQLEADAYPVLAKGTVAYLNAGYSASPVFPEWRYGAEVFQTLPQSFEASLGVRHLAFVGSPVTIFTGSVGRYTRGYWMSLRPFVRDEASGRSASARLLARRYSHSPDSYVGIRLGYGRAPSDATDLSQLSRTNAASAGFHGSNAVSARTILVWLVGYEREERAMASPLHRWELGAGFKLRY